MGLILLILLIVLLMGGLPTWGYSRSWGYGPSGGWGLSGGRRRALAHGVHSPWLLTGHGCDEECAVTKDCQGVNRALAAEEQRVL